MTLDEALSEAIKKDPLSADLTPEEQVIVRYTIKLTKHAYKIGRSDMEELRAAGFDDTAITQINLIASWFNYINRVADGLGIGRLG